MPEIDEMKKLFLATHPHSQGPHFSAYPKIGLTSRHVAEVFSGRLIIIFIIIMIICTHMREREREIEMGSEF